MSCDERPQATRGQDRETQELAESLTNSKKWVSILDPGVFFFHFFLGTILGDRESRSLWECLSEYFGIRARL
jgi:hypothetical protein